MTHPREITEHAAYPRIDAEFRNHVLMAFGDGFACTSPAQAQIALLALQRAFIAGQQDILRQWREAQNPTAKDTQ